MSSACAAVWCAEPSLVSLRHGLAYQTVAPIMSEQLPKSFTVCNGALALDGGSIILSVIDEDRRNHRVLLVQHAFPHRDSDPTVIPGRLYFNENIVDVRSTTEGQLMKLLQAAAVEVMTTPQAGGRLRISPDALIVGNDIKKMIEGDPAENVRTMLKTVIDYVTSERYVTFAATVDEIRRAKPR